MTQQRAQSLGEYTVTISLVILAIMAMTYFMQRGFAARINDSRKFMLDTLDTEIRHIHFLRGGKPYPRMRTEYEPYYLDKQAETDYDIRTNVFIDGPTDQYHFRTNSETAINMLSRELPAPFTDN